MPPGLLGHLGILAIIGHHGRHRLKVLRLESHWPKVKGVEEAQLGISWVACVQMTSQVTEGRWPEWGGQGCGKQGLCEPSRVQVLALMGPYSLSLWNPQGTPAPSAKVGRADKGEPLSGSTAQGQEGGRAMGEELVDNKDEKLGLWGERGCPQQAHRWQGQCKQEGPQNKVTSRVQRLGTWGDVAGVFLKESGSRQRAQLVHRSWGRRFHVAKTVNEDLQGRRGLNPGHVGSA